MKTESKQAKPQQPEEKLFTMEVSPQVHHCVAVCISQYRYTQCSGCFTLNLNSESGKQKFNYHVYQPLKSEWNSLERHRNHWHWCPTQRRCRINVLASRTGYFCLASNLKNQSEKWLKIITIPIPTCSSGHNYRIILLKHWYGGTNLQRLVTKVGIKWICLWKEHVSSLIHPAGCQH